MNLQVAYQCFNLATDQQHILLWVGICHKEGSPEWLIQSSGSKWFTQQRGQWIPGVYSSVTGAKPGMQPRHRQHLVTNLPPGSMTELPERHTWLQSNAWDSGINKELCEISEWQYFPYVLHTRNYTFLWFHRQQLHRCKYNLFEVQCSTQESNVRERPEKEKKKPKLTEHL